MALDDLLISTGVDQLIRLVKERGRIEMGEAARLLKTPLRTVEDWAHALEEEKLISIEYKLTKIYLVWKTPSAQYVAERAGKLEAKASKTKGDVEGLLSKVEEGGAELAQMQNELLRLQSSPIKGAVPADIQKMKEDLSELDRNYNITIKAAKDKLSRLKKKVDAAAPKVDAKGGADIEKELLVLRKFEETLTMQLEENGAFFEALQARLEGLRKKIEAGGKETAIEEMRGEIGEISALKTELAGAIEAIADEHKAILSRLSRLDSKFEEYSRKESVAGAKRKLAEIRKLEEEARRQKDAVDSRLQDSVTLVKKQIAELAQAASKLNAARQNAQGIMQEYLDISEEVSRAGEELAGRQKEISAKISSQVGMLDGYSRGGGGNVSKEELEKVSFLIRELKREQELLEEKVKLLAKESEIVKMEASLAPGAQAAQAARGDRAPQMAAPAAHGASSFVDKIKLSQEEESEFERKREELRSLIRKMWEESKGSGAA